MQVHRASRNIVAAACAVVVATLSRSSSTADQDRIAAAGFLAALVAAWRAHSAHAKTLVSCSGALICVVRNNERILLAAISEGAAELALAAMRAHPDEGLHCNAYFLLNAFLTSGRIGDDGTISVDLLLAKRLLAAGALQFAQRPGGRRMSIDRFSWNAC